MNIGDTVEVEIDGIGTLTNFVKERQNDKKAKRHRRYTAKRFKKFGD